MTQPEPEQRVDATPGHDMTWGDQLQVDDQAKDFLALRHQLTYFLVTAAVVPLGVTLKFAMDIDTKSGLSGLAIALLGAGALVALGSAALSLAGLRSAIRSHNFHVWARYRGQGYEHVDPDTQSAWDRQNQKASRYRSAGFAAVVPAVALQAAFLFTVVLKESPMSNHIGPPRITTTPVNYVIKYGNRYTPSVIEVRVPKRGTGHTATSETSEEDVERIAGDLHRVLLRRLE